MTNHCHDVIMVIVDRLTKVAHFSPMRSSYTGASVANVFMHEIVRLHGIPQRIILDKYHVMTFTFFTSL